MNSTAVPALQPGECQVWWADGAAAGNHLLPVLDEAERARWSRFVPADARAVYLVAHAMLRRVLGAHLRVAPEAIRFSTICRYCGKDHGKPQVESGTDGLEFSLSHSGLRAVIAVARGLPLGIDVEQIKPERNRAALVEAVLSDAEQRAIATLPPAEHGHALLRYWTRKEALLKATGHGLAIAPRSLTMTAPHEAPALVSWEAEPPLESATHLFDLRAQPDCLAALAVLTPGPRPRLVERDAGVLLAAT